MILVIDNYDSFTYNLVQALGSKKYYTFEPTRLKWNGIGTVYEDRFGPQRRSIWWFRFDNNEEETGLDPLAGQHARNVNVTNVKQTRCDIWISGYDGEDDIWALYEAGTPVTGSKLSRLDQSDDIANFK